MNHQPEETAKEGTFTEQEKATDQHQQEQTDSGKMSTDEMPVQEPSGSGKLLSLQGIDCFRWLTSLLL